MPQKCVKLDLTREADNQRAVILWSEQASIREKWPELATLYHIKNETKGGAKEVAIDKSQGVKKGVPDLHLPVARGEFHGLYIEMKTATGRPSREQNWWLAELNRAGYCAKLCHGYQNAVEVILWYLSLKKPQPPVTQCRMG